MSQYESNSCKDRRDSGRFPGLDWAVLPVGGWPDGSPTASQRLHQAGQPTQSTITRPHQAFNELRALYGLGQPAAE